MPGKINGRSADIYIFVYLPAKMLFSEKGRELGDRRCMESAYLMSKLHNPCKFAPIRVVWRKKFDPK
jgi:hypothetical protein